MVAHTSKLWEQCSRAVLGTALKIQETAESVAHTVLIASLTKQHNPELSTCQLAAPAPTAMPVGSS